MNDERARRARVRAQLLGGSRMRRGPADVVSALVGVQAQDETAAALSIQVSRRKGHRVRASQQEHALSRPVDIGQERSTTHQREYEILEVLDYTPSVPLEKAG